MGAAFQRWLSHQPLAWCLNQLECFPPLPPCSKRFMESPLEFQKPLGLNSVRGSPDSPLAFHW
jgi:hypothetical protein